MEKEPITRVMFRVYRSGPFKGNVDALMIDIPSDMSPYNCTSYAHIGQHSSADPRVVMSMTCPALPAEYASLKRELESKPYGYRFEVVLRTPKNALAMRRAKLAV